MLASILVSVLLVILIVSTLRMRRRQDNRDSITRFADARKAMSVTQGKPAVRGPSVTPHESLTESEPANVVVRSGSATLLDPIARRGLDQTRRSFRGDPEMLARRPTVALLPTLVASHCEPDPHPLLPGCERDANTSVVPLPAPRSEAS